MQLDSWNKDKKSKIQFNLPNLLGYFLVGSAIEGIFCQFLEWNQIVPDQSSCCYLAA